MVLSDRARRIQPSATLAISAKAKQMKAEGHNVIGFGAGEPDFDTPEHIKQAAVAALARGETKYVFSQTGKLKQAIAQQTSACLGVDYEPEQVLISCGAKHCLYNIILATCQPGDEVIIPSPYWLSYPEMVRLAGAEPVIVPLDESRDFSLDAEALKRAVGLKTKVIIANSPSNPTGAVFDEAALRVIIDIAAKHGVVVISDDIYDHLVYDGLKFRNVLMLEPGLKDQTVVVNGVSKTYAMTGWRVGWAVGPKEINAAAASIQSHSTSDPSPFALAGALAALEGPQESAARMAAEFDRRREFIVGRLQAMPGVNLVRPRGAFYVFPDVSALMGRGRAERKIENSVDMAGFLLDEGKVAVVPGGPFGSEKHIRLSYAASMADLQEGAARLARCFGLLA